MGSSIVSSHILRRKELKVDKEDKQLAYSELSRNAALLIAIGCLPKDLEFKYVDTDEPSEFVTTKKKEGIDPALIADMQTKSEKIRQVLADNRKDLIKFAFARSSSDITIEMYSLLAVIWKYETIIKDRDDVLAVLDQRVTKSTGISSMNLLVDWDPDTTDRIQTAIIKGDRIVITGANGCGRKSSVGIGLLKALESGYSADLVVSHIQQGGNRTSPMDYRDKRIYTYIPNVPSVSKFMHTDNTLAENLRRRAIFITNDGTDTGGLYDSEHPTTTIDIEEPDAKAMFKIMKRRILCLGFELNDSEIEAITEITSKVKSKVCNPAKSMDVLRRLIINKKDISEQTVNEEVKTMSNFVTGFIGNSSKGIKKLDKALKNKVIGQDEAIDEIISELRKRKLRIGKNKPCTLMFAGQTGLGKTLLCKTLAKALYGSDDKLVRINMNEFQESHAISRFIGAPPGYVGYNDKSIADEISEKGEVILLLDEIEKANIAMDDLMLQLLDEGIINTSSGNNVKLGNSLIIATSKIGTKSTVKGKISFEGGKSTDADMVIKEIKQVMRPEMINRFDNIVVFKPFKKEDIAKIVVLEIQNLFGEINIDKKAKDFLTKKAMDEGNVNVYGGREIGRIVRRNVEEVVIDYMQDNDIGSTEDLGTIVISASGDKITVIPAKETK
jgi:DNA polymerase III delta prime subunit